MSRSIQAKLAALRDEPPAKLMSRLRLVWPHIKAALNRGHTLKVIHQRLLESGIEITYDLLACYVGRLRREDAAAAPARGPESAGEKVLRREDRVENGDVGHDPLENLRERLSRNRPGFHYEADVADKNKRY